LHRQLLTLEDDQATAAARQAILQRIADLRHDLTKQQTALSALRNQPPGSPTDPQALVDRLAALPVLDMDLRDLPTRELREIFASLDLTIHYDHRRHVADLGVTLTARGPAGNEPLAPGLLQQHPHQTPERNSVRLTAQIALPPKRHPSHRQDGKSEPLRARK
jgi:hypothetical protein